MLGQELHHQRVPLLVPEDSNLLDACYAQDYSHPRDLNFHGDHQRALCTPLRALPDCLSLPPTS